MLNRFKKIDVMRVVPDHLKEASYLGVCMSATFVVLLALMVLNQVGQLLSRQVESQLLIDHLKDDKDLAVQLDISFPHYPCALLGLDKMDKLHSHIMDVEENLRKMRLGPDGAVLQRYFNDEGLDTEDRLEVVRAQVAAREGCQLVGDFSIKLVPGNFHISFHHFVPEFRHLQMTGAYRPDFSHRVNRLEFGTLDAATRRRIQRDFRLNTLHTLNGESKLGLMRELGFPHGVQYQMKIVPSRFRYGAAPTAHEMYQYTAVDYKVIGGSLRVSFDFDIENFFMDFRMKDRNYSHFFVQLMSIVGGFFTVFMTLKLFVEDGLMHIAFKRRLGKLE